MPTTKDFEVGDRVAEYANEADIRTRIGKVVAVHGRSLSIRFDDAPVTRTYQRTKRFITKLD